MAVFVHFADGFEEIEALTVVDVLRRAGIDTRMISVTGDRIVTGAHAIPLKTDLLFEQADYTSCAMIVLPGGQPGTNSLAKHAGLCAKIREFYSSGKWLAAICAAPMIFGQMGLLQGKTAVVFPGYEEKLTGARLGRHSVEIDGKMITAKAAGAAFAFAFTIVGQLKDKATADSLRQSMHIE